MLIFANSSDNKSGIAAVDVNRVQLYSFEPYESDSKAESADSVSDSEPDTAELMAVEEDFDQLQNKEWCVRLFAVKL